MEKLKVNYYLTGARLLSSVQEIGETQSNTVLFYLEKGNIFVCKLSLQVLKISKQYPQIIINDQLLGIQSTSDYHFNRSNYQTYSIIQYVIKSKPRPFHTHTYWRRRKKVQFHFHPYSNDYILLRYHYNIQLPTTSIWLNILNWC